MLTDLLTSPAIPVLVVTHTLAVCAGAILEHFTERELADRGDRGVE